MGGHFVLEGQLEWRQLEDGHGGWDCLISDGEPLRTGRPVGVEAAGRRTRRLGLSYLMGGHFGLEGRMDLRQLEDGHGGWDCLISDGRSLRTGGPVGVEAAGRRTRRLGLSYFGWEVTSDWRASWS